MNDPSSYYPQRYRIEDWLPTSVKEIRDLGWDQPDIVLVTGDAYVDHPSFGIAVIGRILEQEGFRVAVIPQPNWRDDLRDFVKMGRPRLFFGISAGNMDSMVNHYTANRRLRSNDAYSPGDRSGFRPDRAVTVYGNILRKLYPDSLIIAGGIEASLRRLAHYDYWDDAIRPSLLADSGLDAIVYGNGEKSIIDLARKIREGQPKEAWLQDPQLAWITPAGTPLPEWPGRKTVQLHPAEAYQKDKSLFAKDFRIIEEESNTLLSARLIQEHGDRMIVVNPPHDTATTAEADKWHDLPFTRLPHPRYWKKPVIPAFEMIRFSVNIHNGCFGGCAFCTISAHQGKHVVSRSRESILSEVRKVTQMPGFKGYLSDLGGPSANMYGMKPLNRSVCLKCRKPSCIHPAICKNLDISHKEIIELYRAARAVPGVKKAFIGSGIRYDLFLNDRRKDDRSLRDYPIELIRHHVSGRLKVAPEHTRDGVLKVMRKPGFGQFLELRRTFDRINQEHALRQEIVPYFISSHPGCTIGDMAELAVETQSLNLRTEQVQDFTPTPMTLASAMFYSGLDPYTMKPVFVEKDPKAKLLQRSFFFTAGNPEREAMIRALRKINRNDLVESLFFKHKLKHVKRRTSGGHKN
jgi:uncharacterized radical SAM protein YgiQ